MHRGMADMMKAMGGAKRGPMAQIANALGMGGGGMPSAEEMQKMAEQMQQGGGLPPGMPGLPKNIPGMPGLPGLGAPKLPGLGGFPGLGKKK
jgi:signal recognition particle subunit SRP54